MTKQIKLTYLNAAFSIGEEMKSHPKTRSSTLVRQFVSEYAIYFAQIDLNTFLFKNWSRSPKIRILETSNLNIFFGRIAIRVMLTAN